MKIECLPNPKIVITFDYDELKMLIGRISQLWSFKYETGWAKPEDKVIDQFIKDINKVLGL